MYIFIFYKLTNTSNYERLNDSIKVWESQVINSMVLNDTTKEGLLVTSSIARWSTAYWDEQNKLGELSKWWGFPCVPIIKKDKHGNITSTTVCGGLAYMLIDAITAILQYKSLEANQGSGFSYQDWAGVSLTQGVRASCKGKIETF